MGKPIPQDVLDFALELLKDGAGYVEAARSTGVSEMCLNRHFPGYGLPRNQHAARRELLHALDRITWSGLIKK
jgi:hypothetical protein